jgi:hypothetical protein
VLLDNPWATWMPVRAGRDYLGQYTRAGALDAVAELIWNGLDAEADMVNVDVETATMGIDELRYVTRVVVTDNGHGMDHARAVSAFESLGDSWKKTLNGRTVNDKRALHGSKGRGRFLVYSIGHQARWSSVSHGPDGAFRVEIVGEQDRIDGFVIEDPVPTTEPAGTRVAVLVEQGRSNSSLLRDDLPLQLTARLAGHLLANEDIVVRVNGRRLDPAELIEGDPLDVPLDQIAAVQLDGHEVPVLTIVDWTEEMRRAPSIVLCNESGMALMVLDKPVANPAVKVTGYLRWSGFSRSALDMAFATVHYPEILAEAIKVFDHHVKTRLGAVTATIVTRLKEEGSYPYETDNLADPIQQTEQEMFDLVAVTARGVLSSGSRQARAMSARLFKLALEERPESLDSILAGTLELSFEEREELADMLRHSSLGNIVGAAAEVTRRVDLISALRHAVYSDDMASRMREVDQLHPLVKDNVWLFGEDWRLSRSEASLTTVLRDVLGDEVMLEADLAASGGQVRREDGTTGRLDLVLQRTIRSPGSQHRLVVELKRPKVALGEKELTQIRSYARALSRHAGMGPSKWTFWLVGAHLSEDITDQMDQRDRAWGHIVNQEHYEVWVTTWGQLLDDAARRLEFYREQLSYDIGQEAAVARVRERHGALLPDDQSARACPVDLLGEVR